MHPYVLASAPFDSFAPTLQKPRQTDLPHRILLCIVEMNILCYFIILLFEIFHAGLFSTWVSVLAFFRWSAAFACDQLDCTMFLIQQMILKNTEYALPQSKRTNLKRCLLNIQTMLYHNRGIFSADAFKSAKVFPVPCRLLNRTDTKCPAKASPTSGSVRQLSPRYRNILREFFPRNPQFYG